MFHETSRIFTIKTVMIDSKEYQAKRISYYVMKASRCGYKYIYGWELWNKDKYIRGGISHDLITESNFPTYPTLKILLKGE